MARLVEFDVVTKIGTRNYLPESRDWFGEVEAAAYIRNGWAHDAKTGEAGELKPGPVTISPADIISKAVK